MRIRFYVFAVVAAILFLVLMIIFGASGPVGYLRGLVAQGARPVTRTALEIGQWLGFGLAGLSPERVRVLEEESSRLEATSARAAWLQKENESLARALGLREEFGPGLKSARVLDYQQIMGRESLVIDLGRDEGVVRGDIVIDENRLLIGQISEAGIGFSKVAIASNPGVTFPAALEPLGGKVLAKGLGARALGLELIPRDAPVRGGDFVIWNHQNERIRSAVFAARVVASGTGTGSGVFKTGRAILLADPERARLVMVLTRTE